MSPKRRPRLAFLWVGLISAWVLTGALFKLLWGTPALLPRVVRELPLELGLTYKLAIGIELAIVAVALSKARWGWRLQVALLLAFDLVLATQIAAGETNCGCFGAKLSVNPWVMLAIDSVLLLGLLCARPWQRLGAGLSWWAPVILAALGLALPWSFDRQVGPGEVVADGSTLERGWLELDVESWVGRDVWDTPLAQPPLSDYLDVNQLFLDGLWVFWRSTCEHCAAHLEDLALNQDGEMLLTLIRIEEPTDTESNRLVHVLPSGNNVQNGLLPPTVSYVIQTPAELLLHAGKILAAREAVTSETSLLGPR